MEWRVSEINEYFHARFVQILKAPELISIWTILTAPGYLRGWIWTRFPYFTSIPFDYLY